MNADQIKTAQDLSNALGVAKEDILLGVHQGARIMAARNKFKNGFAVYIVGKGGKYNVDGCRHWNGVRLDGVIASCERYIEKYNLGVS